MGILLMQKKKKKGLIHVNVANPDSLAFINTKYVTMKEKIGEDCKFSRHATKICRN